MKQMAAPPAAPQPENPPTPAAGSGGQSAVGLALAAAALWLAWGTWQIPASTADAIDGGARLVPALCAVALLWCGLWLVWEARHGGWRNLAVRSGHGQARITPGVWVSAGILLGGLLMAQGGFVLAAALCYGLALQGLRQAAAPGQRLQLRQLAVDAVVGLLLAGVVYLLFTQLLGIALPAGWLAWN